MSAALDVLTFLQPLTQAEMCLFSFFRDTQDVSCPLTTARQVQGALRNPCERLKFAVYEMQKEKGEDEGVV